MQPYVKGRVDQYGRAVNTGDLSNMGINFGLFGSSLLILSFYSFMERRKRERKKRFLRARRKNRIREADVSQFMRDKH